MKASPPPIRVRLAHAAPGRIRLRAPDLAKNPERMAAFADTLSALPNLIRIVGRPSTGTIILEFEGSPTALTKALVATGRVTIAPRPKEVLPISQVTQFSAAQLDWAVRSQTKGALDAKTALGILLFGAAVFQATQGRLIGPTATLMMSVFSLMGSNGKK